MSLARPLLVLACAALLAACAAQVPRPRASDRPGRLANNDQCTTKYIGSLTGTMVQLPTVLIQPGKENGKIDIPDNCPAQTGLPLRGEVVRVCDDVAPQVTVVGFSPALVHRLGLLDGFATVDVTQYCS